jgi:hypothetical protein
MNPRQHVLVRVAFVLALACCARAVLAQGSSDPCKLLTPAEVSGIVGVTVTAGQPMGTNSCQWGAQDASKSSVRATLRLMDLQGFTSMEKPLAGVTKATASGIGDGAIYSTLGNLVTLSVKKGKVAFAVRLYGVPDADKQMAMEKSLALDVVARL